jgi:PIN domain nuclease of toxin-antitoxin system
MRILLDTCEFLWFISGDSRLPVTTKQAIQNADNEIYLSVVSLWEITVKHSIGRLPLPQPPATYIPLQRDKHGIQSLSLEETSVQRLATLPAIHRDPFDRMLVCQAQAHNLQMASSDPLIKQYSVVLLT